MGLGTFVDSCAVPKLRAADALPAPNQALEAHTMRRPETRYKGLTHATTDVLQSELAATRTATLARASIAVIASEKVGKGALKLSTGCNKWSERLAERGWRRDLEQQLVRMHIALAPIEEQHEIIRKMEAMSMHADLIRAESARARALLDRLTQAALAKAFRGEFSENSHCRKNSP